MSNPNYEEAFEELQQIVSDIEEGQISVDELSEKVSRASVLIKICKEKLTATEESVQKILAAIEQPIPEDISEETEEEDHDDDNDEDEEESSEGKHDFPF